MYTVGKGRIGGNYCDGFHVINEDGTVGGKYARKMSPKEKERILKDIARHRSKILEDLANLNKAQEIIETIGQITNYDW